MAQLGARFHGMEEVIGSIPIRSTNNPLKLSQDEPAQAHLPRGVDFRLLFHVEHSGLTQPLPRYFLRKV